MVLFTFGVLYWKGQISEHRHSNGTGIFKNQPDA